MQDFPSKKNPCPVATGQGIKHKIRCLKTTDYNMLSLQEIVDDLPAVAPERGMHVGDVHPVGSFRVVLPDELVELAVL